MLDQISQFDYGQQMDIKQFVTQTVSSQLSFEKVVGMLDECVKCVRFDQSIFDAAISNEMICIC